MTTQAKENYELGHMPDDLNEYGVKQGCDCPACVNKRAEG